MQVLLTGPPLELLVETPELLDELLEAVVVVPELLDEVVVVPELLDEVEAPPELLDDVEASPELLDDDAAPPAPLDELPELLDDAPEVGTEPPVSFVGVLAPPPHAAVSATKTPNVVAVLRCEVILSSRSSRSRDARKRTLTWFMFIQDRKKAHLSAKYR